MDTGSSFSLVIIFFQSFTITHFGDVCDAWEGSRVDRGELGEIHTYPVIFWKWRVFSVFACLPQGKRCLQHPNAVFPKRSPDWRFFLLLRTPLTRHTAKGKGSYGISFVIIVFSSKAKNTCVHVFFRKRRKKSPFYWWLHLGTQLWPGGEASGLFNISIIIVGSIQWN